MSDIIQIPSSISNCHSIVALSYQRGLWSEKSWIWIYTRSGSFEIIFLNQWFLIFFLGGGPLLWRHSTPTPGDTYESALCISWNCDCHNLNIFLFSRDYLCGGMTLGLNKFESLSHKIVVGLWFWRQWQSRNVYDSQTTDNW
jgi:hypothetical protein